MIVPIRLKMKPFHSLLAISLLLSPLNALAFDSAPQAMEDNSPIRASNAESMGMISDKPENSGNLYGRVRSLASIIGYQQGSTNLNYMNTHTDARLGYVASSKVEGWTASGTIEMDLKSDLSTVATRFLYVTLEDEEYSFRLGRQEPGGSTLGGKYLQKMDESLTIGETVGKGDYFTFEMKDQNLKFVLGRNASANDASSAGIPAQDENAVALFWESEGDGFQMTASATLIDERTARNEVIDLTYTPSAEAYRGLALGVSVPMDGGRVSLNLDHETEDFLDTAVSSLTTTTGILFWDQGLEENKGYTVALSLQNETDGSDNPRNYFSLDYSYVKTIGFMRIYGALSQTVDNDLDRETIYQSQIGMGMSAHFK